MTLIVRALNTYKNFRVKFITLTSSKVVYINAWLYRIELGKRCSFIGNPVFYKNKGAFIFIGNDCTFISTDKINFIGINHRCIIAALRNSALIRIGNNCGFSGVSIGAAQEVSIGNNVTVGANCIITDTNWHNIDPKLRHTPDPKPKKVIIENNVFIGVGSIILKGVTIGENSVVAAGSVVTKSIPSNVVAGGNPCRVLRCL